MSLPEFRAVYRLYRVPDGDLFRADLPDSARGIWKHNGAATRYNGDKTLGYYLAESQLELIDEITAPTAATAEWEAGDICSWTVSKIYPYDSEIVAWLLANVRPTLANRPRVFAAVKIVSADDADTSDNFDDLLLGNVISNPSDVAAGDAAEALKPEALGEMPAWTRRGMSGPVMDVNWGLVENGIELHLRGGSWLFYLQATAHHRDTTDLSIEPSDWATILSSTLTANASYTIAEFAENLLGTDDVEGTTSLQISLDQDNVGSTEIVSGVGLHSLVVASELTASVGDPTLFAKGGHNLLQTIQRGVESQEAWLDGRTNLWRVRPFGGTETAPKLVWDAADMIRPRLSDTIPKAVGFLTRQNDYRRNWVIYAYIQELTEIYGHIQKANVSVAPKPQGFTAEPTWNAQSVRSAILQTSDRLILNHIRAQNKAEALAEADNLSGTCMLRWGDGTRFGIDFDIGDIVEVRLGSNDAFSSVRGMRRGLVIRKVSIALDGNKRWGVSVGLGALADVAPAFNPDQVAMPARTPPKTTTSPSPTTPTPTSPTPEPPTGPRGGQTEPLFGKDFDFGTPPKPKATDDDFEPAPYDEGSETLPGANENPNPPANDPYFKPAPYDPGSETLPGAGEPPPKPPNYAEHMYRNDPRGRTPTRTPNPAEGRSKGTTPPDRTPPKPPKRTPNPAERRSKGTPKTAAERIAEARRAGGM